MVIPPKAKIRAAIGGIKVKRRNLITLFIKTNKSLKVQGSWFFPPQGTNPWPKTGRAKSKKRKKGQDYCLVFGISFFEYSGFK